MVERSELESRVRRMVSSDITYRVLKSLGERGVRKLTKKAKEIVELLEDYEEGAEEKRFFARTQEETEDKKARTLRQGIDIFKERYPEYAEELEGIITETRSQRNNYLVYGIREGFRLGEEDYVQVMMDLGFKKREAASLYPHIVAISERQGKAGEQKSRKILIGEADGEDTVED